MKEKKEAQMAFRLTEKERRKLKMLAAKMGKTVQAVIFEALDKTFPGWREQK
jgi:predicted DNA-binding protein